jgi:protein-tyrosine phosphatase
LIDLHCHLLPGVDDGAKNLEMSLAMARLALADGITTIACTPHIMPGVYNNTGPAINEAVARLRTALAENGIALRLVSGADVHVAPDLVEQLRQGQALTLNGTRYLLLEPPHHVMPPRLEDHIFRLQTAGFVPILTHPERLSWLDVHYALVKRLVYSGLLVQITGGSVLGRFGRRPRYWAERMLDDGLCHILASDAHNTEQRVPRLSEARAAVADRLGADEATNTVVTRPLGILNNISPSALQPLPQPAPAAPPPSGWGGLFKRVRGAGGRP